MFAQVLFLIAMVFIGGFIEFWARRFEIQGIGVWLPLGLLVSYVYSPLWGFLFAFAIVVISFALFPYELHGLFIMGACIAATFFATSLFTITKSNFFMMSMIFVVGYNLASNIIWLLSGSNWFRLIKFALLSIAFNLLVLSKLGWVILVWLKGG